MKNNEYGEDRKPGMLKDLVAYSGGAVVSKQIMKEKTGTVTVFAFDRGEGLSEHTAPFDALVHVLDGEASVRIGDVSHSVREGEFVIMPAGKPHALNARTPFKMLLVMIKTPES